MKDKFREAFTMVKGVLAVAFEDYKRNLAKENAVDKFIDFIGLVSMGLFIGTYALCGIVACVTYLINLF